jgi:hypothetical protein
MAQISCLLCSFNKHPDQTRGHIPNADPRCKIYRINTIVQPSEETVSTTELTESFNFFAFDFINFALILCLLVESELTFSLL